jgi:hypothetical protein
MRILILFLLSTIVSGCANVEVRRVTSYDQPGIRYWRPAPYLILHQTVKDGKAICDATMVTLPDKSEEYAITMSAGVGAVKATPTLHDGWRLDSLSTDVDSKASENLTAIAGLIKSVAPNGISGRTAVRQPAADTCSGFYRIDYRPDGQIKGFSKVSI